MNLLRYLRGTSSLALRYTKDGQTTVQTYTDGSFANCPDTSRSTTGVTLTLAGAAIVWVSKLEWLVMLSSTEVEYCALSRGLREIQFINNLLTDLGGTSLPMEVHTDSQPARALAEAFVTNQRTKHMNVRFHHVRQAVEEKVISLHYLATNKQPADCLTKALPKDAVKHFRNQLGLYPINLVH